MADVIDFGKFQDASAEVHAAKCLVDAMEGIKEGGPLEGLHGLLVAWINKAGHVEYRFSENIAEDSVLAMIGPINIDCSWKLLEEDFTEEDDEGA